MSYIRTARSSLAGQSQRKPLSVIILSASPARRMKSYGPKPLFKIAGKTLVEHQISHIKEVYPHSEFVVVVGYEAEKVCRVRCDYRIVENLNYDDTNEVEEIRLALNNIHYDDVLIIGGDIVFHENITNKLVGKMSCVVVDDGEQFDKTEVGVADCDGLLTNLSYSLREKWCDLSYFTNGELDLLRKYCTRDKNKRLFHEALAYVVENGGKFIINYAKTDRVYRIKEQ